MIIRNPNYYEDFNPIDEYFQFIIESKVSSNNINNVLNIHAIESLQETGLIYPLNEQEEDGFFAKIGNALKKFWGWICNLWDKIIGWVKSLFKKADVNDEDAKEGAKEYLNSNPETSTSSSSSNSSDTSSSSNSTDSSNTSDSPDTSSSSNSTDSSNTSDSPDTSSSSETNDNPKKNIHVKKDIKAAVNKETVKDGWSWNGSFKYEYASRETQNVIQSLLTTDTFENVDTKQKMADMVNNMMDNKHNIQKDMIGTDKVRNAMETYVKGEHISNIYAKYAKEFMAGTIDDNHRLLKIKTEQLNQAKNALKSYIDNVSIKIDRDTKAATKSKDEYQLNRFKHVNTFMSDMNGIFAAAYSTQSKAIQNLANDILECKRYFASIKLSSRKAKSAQTEAAMENISNTFLESLAMI